MGNYKGRTYNGPTIDFSKKEEIVDFVEWEIELSLEETK